MVLDLLASLLANNWRPRFVPSQQPSSSVIYLKLAPSLFLSLHPSASLRLDQHTLSPTLIPSPTPHALYTISIPHSLY